MSLQARGNSDPGLLDLRIVVQSATTARDALGGAVQTWATLATLWASRVGLSGGRLYAAAAKQSEATVMFRIRYNAAVRAFMRVVHGQATYEIVAPPVELGRRHLLELECRALGQADVAVAPAVGDFGTDFDNTDFNSGAPPPTGGDFGTDFDNTDFNSGAPPPSGGDFDAADFGSDFKTT